MINKLGLILLAALFIYLNESAEYHSIPDSLRDVSDCGVGEPSLLCDPYRKLNLAEGDKDGAFQIHVRLEHLRRASRCACDDFLRHGKCRRDSPQGYTISVLVLDRWANYILSPSSKEVTDFIDSTRRRLSDRSQCDDDVLIVLFTYPKIVRTSVGTVAAAALTPEFVDQVSREAQNYLLKDDYTRCLMYIIHEYSKKLLTFDTASSPSLLASDDLAVASVFSKGDRGRSDTIVDSQLGDGVHLDDEILWPWWHSWPWTAFLNSYTTTRWATVPHFLWLRVLLLIVFIVILAALILAFAFSVYRLVITLRRRRSGYAVGHFQPMNSRSVGNADAALKT